MHDLKSNLTQLVGGRHTSEAALRTTLLNVMVQLGFNAEIERNGADVVILDKRIVLEAKLKAGPNLHGRRRDETQYEQLQRYIELYQEGDDQPTLFSSSSKLSPWRGILTNGQGWWAWDWHGNYGVVEPVVEQMIFKRGEERELEGWLLRLLERKRLR